MKKLVVSGSQLAKLNWCQAEHFARYVAKRRKSGEWSHPAQVGIAAHAVWAEKLKGLAHPPPSVSPVQEGYLRACEEKGAVVDTKAVREAGYVDYWAGSWWSENGRALPWVKVHKVETPFEIEVGEFKADDGEVVIVAIEGIFDSVVEGAGAGMNALWHAQLKTRAPSKDFATFEGIIAHSYHELFYAHAVKEQFVSDLPYGGTMLIAIDKLSPTSKDGDIRTTAEAVHVSYLPITDAAIERALHDLMAQAPVILAQMEALQGWDASAAPFYMPAAQTGREHGCGGRFGNSRCGMWHVCRGELSLGDPFSFESYDPRERYANQVEE